MALNYPNSAEGKSAKVLVKKAIPAIEKLELVDNTLGTKFKLILAFKKNNKTIQVVKEALEKELKETNQTYLSVSEDYYNRTQTFLVIHGFITPELATNFYNATAKKIKALPLEHEAVSSENYKVIQLRKKWIEFKKNSKK